MELLQLFRENIIDPKTRQKKRYQTSDILFLSILAISVGATNIKEVATWIKFNIKTKVIKDILGVKFALVPSNATVHRRLSSLEPKKIVELFRTWSEENLGKSLKDLPPMIDPTGREKNCIDLLAEIMQDNGLIMVNHYMMGRSDVIILQDLVDKMDNVINTFAKPKTA
jgi:hypothetical protein